MTKDSGNSQLKEMAVSTKVPFNPVLGLRGQRASDPGASALTFAGVCIGPLTFGLCSDPGETSRCSLILSLGFNTLAFSLTQTRTNWDESRISPSLSLIWFSVLVETNSSKNVGGSVSVRRSPSKDVSATEEWGGGGGEERTNQLKDCVKSGAWLLRDRCRVTSSRTLTMTLPPPSYSLSISCPITPQH